MELATALFGLALIVFGMALVVHDAYVRWRRVRRRARTLPGGITVTTSNQRGGITAGRVESVREP